MENILSIIGFGKIKLNKLKITLGLDSVLIEDDADIDPSVNVGIKPQEDSEEL